MIMDNILETRNLSVAIKKKPILDDISIKIKRGKIYSIIGPNGSGKTTLIRSLSRNIRPPFESVFLEGDDIRKLPQKELARRQAVLSQLHSAQSSITVRELVSYGRYAHKDWWRGGSDKDADIIDWALDITGIRRYEHRILPSLSGGERQQAWIAMAIAQKPKLFLLDEPTTFLDICYQLELLEMISDLNAKHGITIIMVLHDINQAIRYSDEILVFKEGRLHSCCAPEVLLDGEIIEEVFSVKSDVLSSADSKQSILYPRRSV